MWTFLLLHGRLRLSVRLAHRHGNAPRSCVRADTPVVAVTLEASHHSQSPNLYLNSTFIRNRVIKNGSKDLDI